MSAALSALSAWNGIAPDDEEQQGGGDDSGGQDDPPIQQFTISKTLSHCSASNSAATI